jgi:putative lipoprotein
VRAYLNWDRGHLARNAGGMPAVRFSAGIVLVVLFLTLALAGCGRRGAPTPPPDEPSTYPRPYPNE